VAAADAIVWKVELREPRNRSGENLAVLALLQKGSLPRMKNCTLDTTVFQRSGQRDSLWSLLQPIFMIRVYSRCGFLRGRKDHCQLPCWSHGDHDVAGFEAILNHVVPPTNPTSLLPLSSFNFSVRPVLSHLRFQILKSLLQLIHINLLRGPTHPQSLLLVRFRDEVKMDVIDFLMCRSSVVL
jgi:hypothetical protein